jgi:HNH endonuclease
LGRRTSINKHLRVQVLSRDGYKCRMCGRSQSEVPLQVDHIVAVAQGGSDEIHNLAALCRDCNLGKSDYHFAGYAEMDIAPERLEQHFRFTEDDRIGDYRRYHLYCYYRGSNEGRSFSGAFHREWKITRTEIAVLGGSDLPARRRKEETTEFSKQIRRELITERKRLIETADGLLKE